MYIRGLNNWAVTAATLAQGFIILDDLVMRCQFLIYKLNDKIFVSGFNSEFLGKALLKIIWQMGKLNFIAYPIVNIYVEL